MALDRCILNIGKTNINSKMPRAFFSLLPKIGFNKLIFQFRIRADSQIYWIYSRDSIFLLQNALSYNAVFIKAINFVACFGFVASNGFL